MPEEKVKITKSVYERLVRAEKELLALEAGGVDNWEGYSESFRVAGLFDDEDEEDDD